MTYKYDMNAVGRVSSLMIYNFDVKFVLELASVSHCTTAAIQIKGTARSIYCQYIDLAVPLICMAAVVQCIYYTDANSNTNFTSKLYKLSTFRLQCCSLLQGTSNLIRVEIDHEETS